MSHFTLYFVLILSFKKLTGGLPGGAVVTSCATEPGFEPRLCGVTHNWSSVVRVRESLTVKDILVSSRTSDSCGGPGAVRANQGCQVYGVSSDTLVRLASGLDAHCVKKLCGLVGVVFRGTHDFRPSSIPSPYGSCSDETRY
jgi:hypothetical protein